MLTVDWCSQYSLLENIRNTLFYLEIKAQFTPYLYKLHEVFKIGLFIDGELAVVVDDAIVLHLTVAAHTQSVVAREVSAFPHQEQACLRGVKQPLRLIPSYLAMKPSGGRGNQKSVHRQNQQISPATPNSHQLYVHVTYPITTYRLCLHPFYCLHQSLTNIIS